MTGIDVSLDPSVYICKLRGARKDCLAACDANDGRNVKCYDVIEDDRRLKPNGGVRTSVEDGGVPHDSVDYCDPTDAFNSDIEPNLRMVDIDSLEIPPPVPKHLDGGVCAVDGEVSDGELLISDFETDVPAVDDEVAHKTTAEDPNSEPGSKKTEMCGDFYLPSSIKMARCRVPFAVDNSKTMLYREVAWDTCQWIHVAL